MLPIDDHSNSFDAIPFLAAEPGRAAIVSEDGQLEHIGADEALARLSARPHGLVHAGFTARRLGAKEGYRLAAPFDVADLAIFVRPNAKPLPNPRGIARMMGWPAPASLEDQAICLRAAARALLHEAAQWDAGVKTQVRPIAQFMAEAGWPWADSILAALGPAPPKGGQKFPDWSKLSQWEDEPPTPPPSNHDVSPDTARQRLKKILGEASESRPSQSDYAALAASAFAPRMDDKTPIAVLAEAGTGIGKTAGYLAPALTWAERNGRGLWISTYTKTLQRQLSETLLRIYADWPAKPAPVAVRKGRENYLCFLNFDEAVSRRRLMGGSEAVALGLVGRWASASEDGDLLSGDFPAWIWPTPNLAPQLTLRSSECVYSACPHYRICFVEKSVRRARNALVVVANHALVMSEAMRGGNEHSGPLRIVFDEGHQLFDAADAAFAVHLSGVEGAELRRWIRGPEGRSLRRGRGLRDRLGDLLSDEPEAPELAQAIDANARNLAGEGWQQRVAHGRAAGHMEAFLSAVRAQVLARSEDKDSAYGAECDVRPVFPTVLDAGQTLDRGLREIAEPMAALAGALRKGLEERAEEWDSSQRTRADALARGLERRALVIIPAWRESLASLSRETPTAFSDWFGIERLDGRDYDTGHFRHWIDPSLPLAHEVIGPAHGVLITSATLRDKGSGAEDAEAWAFARTRTGMSHLGGAVRSAAFGSPFDFEKQTRVFVVRDVERSDLGQLAGAYRGLFEAAGGGALGLFTSIRTLRAVHARIVQPMSDAGLTLLAQHVDGIDTGTLVSLFRDEEDACLLGTDALRDGVDVPGRALRLVVFDRVPWSRPDILHRARRAHFGKSWEEALTRGRLAQAFGRLIRRASDRGVFVILDNRTPTRILAGLPQEAPVIRTGLKEAIAGVKAFIGQSALAGQAARS
jgi:ATP-dependent DNA helicase DinG